jgi:hypothetical protein
VYICASIVIETVSTPHPSGPSLLLLFSAIACKCLRALLQISGQLAKPQPHPDGSLTFSKFILSHFTARCLLIALTQPTQVVPSSTSYQPTTTNNMARGAMAIQLSGLSSNPYPRPKEHIPMNTTCELCDRTMPTKDWPSHKNSKKHRAAEAKENGTATGTNGNGFGGDAAGFTADGGFGGNDNFGAATDGNDGWNSTGNDAGWGSGATTGTSSYGNNTGGGGDRACFGCGQTGHQKRDCPSGGGGGGDRACYGCGETGHQKRDCPNGGGGGGGGQECFNCGEVGYVVLRDAK